MTDILCKTTGLQITFPNRLQDFIAVHGFDIEVRRGEIVGLIGESGADDPTTALDVSVQKQVRDLIHCTMLHKTTTRRCCWMRPLARAGEQHNRNG